MTRLVAAGALLAAVLAGPAQSAQVPEAKLGKAVADRKIAEETTRFAAGEKAYLWLRVEDASNEMLTVTWKVNDLSFPVELAIGGSPWRTWASKTLHIVGDWSVSVTDSAGTVLSETKFIVQ